MCFKKKYKFISLIIMVLAAVSSLALARGVWIEGEVTKAPWKVNSQYRIEVDGISYGIMSDARITYRYERNRGAYDERKVEIRFIRMGHKIMIKAYKNNIIQIILF